MSKKKSSLWISPKMLQNNRKALFSSMWLTLCRKTFLLIFIPFYLFNQKKLFKQIQISSGLPLSNMVRKTNFLSFSVLYFQIVTFMFKKEKFSMNFLKNVSKQLKGIVLAVCGSLFGEKHFFLIFISFYWFDQKKLFKQIQIFLGICLFSNMLT